MGARSQAAHCALENLTEVLKGQAREPSRAASGSGTSSAASRTGAAEGLDGSRCARSGYISRFEKAAEEERLLDVGHDSDASDLASTQHPETFDVEAAQTLSGKALARRRRARGKEVVAQVSEGDQAHPRSESMGSGRASRRAGVRSALMKGKSSTTA